MSKVVLFDLSDFLAIYPETMKMKFFIDLSDEQKESVFNNIFTQAESVLNNTPCSVVKDLKQRKMLLYLLARHIVDLRERALNGGIVGRITSATEGSVSVSAEMPSNGANSAWYNQTPFGADFWRLTSKYRRFKYVSGRKYAGWW